jgi:hypothetical protein
MAQKDLKNSVLSILDGATHSIEVKNGDGTIAWTVKRPMKYVKNRGKLDTVRKGDEEPVEIQFSAIYTYLKGDTGDEVNPYEALTKTGNASAWVSTDTDTCAPYAVDLQLVYTPPCSSAKSERITFEDFRAEDIGGEEKEGTLSFKGMANITAPTVARFTP